MIKTIFDEKYEAGVAEGEIIGFEKGEAKERNLWASDKIETLLQILTKRLGEVSPNVRNKLNSINDRAALGELTDIALDCKTFDEFEAAFNK